MKLSCEFHYDSAHFLTKVPEGHKCARLHGHTYHLTVTLSGPVRDDGFVMDFAEVKACVAPIIKMLDHYCLNDVPGLENPTVENQLVWLWDKFGALPVHELSLREGESNAATYDGQP